jgi:hypothetical protein
MQCQKTRPLFDRFIPHIYHKTHDDDAECLGRKKKEGVESVMIIRAFLYCCSQVAIH